jgi:glutathione S-transferase
MRELVFATGSSFARGIRILLDELCLEYVRHEFLSAPSPVETAFVAPTLQVPTLRDRGVTLWDSGVIAEYLMSTYPDRAGDPLLARHLARPETEMEDRLSLATVQTLGTAIATIGQMTWTGVTLPENSFLVRCAERVHLILGWAEEQVGETHGFFHGELSAQDVFLACHLRFAMNRPLGLDLQMHLFPKVNALLGRLDLRESFRRNPIPWWEPGVAGYESDGMTPIYGPSGM